MDYINRFALFYRSASSILYAGGRWYIYIYKYDIGTSDTNTLSSGLLINLYNLNLPHCNSLQSPQRFNTSLQNPDPLRRTLIFHVLPIGQYHSNKVAGGKQKIQNIYRTYGSWPSALGVTRHEAPKGVGNDRDRGGIYSPVGRLRLHFHGLQYNLARSAKQSMARPMEQSNRRCFFFRLGSFLSSNFIPKFPFLFKTNPKKNRKNRIHLECLAF